MVTTHTHTWKAGTFSVLDLGICIKSLGREKDGLILSDNGSKCFEHLYKVDVKKQSPVSET